MKIKRASIFTKLVVTILAVYAVISLINLQERVSAAEEANGLLAAQVEEKNISNNALRYSIDNSNSPETIEDIARSKLGLVRPGEKIYYDISN